MKNSELYLKKKTEHVKEEFQKKTLENLLETLENKKNSDLCL